MYTPPDKTSFVTSENSFALHPPALMLPKTVFSLKPLVLGNPDTTDFEPVVDIHGAVDYSLQPCSVSAENTYYWFPVLELVDKSTVTLGLDMATLSGASWTNLGKSSSAGNYWTLFCLLKDTLNTNVANHRSEFEMFNFLYNGTWDKPINRPSAGKDPYVSGTPTAAELAGGRIISFTGADNKRFYFRVRLGLVYGTDDNGKYPAATPVNHIYLPISPVASSISWNTLYTKLPPVHSGAEGWYKFFYQGRVTIAELFTHSQLLNATISAGAGPGPKTLLQGNTIAGYFGTTFTGSLTIRYTVPSGAIYPDSPKPSASPQTLKLNISGNCPANDALGLTLVASDLQSPDASFVPTVAIKDTVLTVRDALPAIVQGNVTVYYDRINLATLFNFSVTLNQRNTKAVFTGYPGTGNPDLVVKLTPAIAALTSGPTPMLFYSKESALLVYDQVNREPL
ncbi:hypothetical protein SPFM20_00137 [Salmonella phage SPFM20]|nr:hypothetical protein SPFM20_00137 [Salmonella phage SPFM20]